MLQVSALHFLRCWKCAQTKEACCQLRRQEYWVPSPLQVLCFQSTDQELLASLDSIKALHFVGSKVTFHLAADTLIFSRSLFRLVPENACSLVYRSANSVESSAHRYNWFSQVYSRSSMKTENRRGLSMEPWGTEALMGEASDDWPEKTTLMDLPWR